MNALHTGLIGAVCLCAVPAQPRLAPLDESGYQRLIASSRGQVLLVDFWATWCPPCRAELPDLLRLEARYRKSGLKLATISCDEPEQEEGAAKFLAEQRVPGTAYIKRAASDDKFIDSIDPKWSGALPALFLYDRQGRKVKTFIGETDMAALEAYIRKLVSAQ